MLRIGICDDAADARDALRIQLEKILNEEKEQIVYEFSTGAGAVHWLETHPGEIDLLFLDVEMAGTNGMAAAEAVRRFDTELMIVFVTGYSDYVFDGYKVNALDYIIKPAKSERLLEVLRRVRAQLDKRKNLKSVQIDIRASKKLHFLFEDFENKIKSCIKWTREGNFINE